MAWLVVVRGPHQGQRFSLDADRIVIGRSPSCDITVPGTAVSRQHAHVVRLKGKHYLEDLASRNKTFLNHEELAPRTQVALQEGDRIRICDFVCAFVGAAAEPRPEQVGTRAAATVEASSSTILEAALSTGGSYVLKSLTPDHLRLVLEVTNRFSRTLELDLLLPKIGEYLAQLFPQAEQCLVILRGEDPNDLAPRVVKTRGPADEAPRFSRSIILRCLETAQAFLTNDAGTDSRLPPTASVHKLQLRSVMCAPLCDADGRALAAVQLDCREPGKKFSEADLRLLVGVAHQASIALANALQFESLLAREQLERDLELAGQMQRSILPEQLPQIPGYEFYAHYESALEVGGDYYDFIPLAGGRLAVTLGDVAGKGISAALLMAKLSSDARFCLQAEADPAVAVGRLNELIYSHTSRTDRFVTLAAAAIDPAAGAATLVSAGHLLPLLYRRATGAVEEALPRALTGLPLGVQPRQTFPGSPVALELGDTLVLFTDGVSDAVSAADQLFQVDGIRTVLQQAGPQGPQAVGRRIVEAVRQHTAGRGRYDDLTLVCFGRTG